MKFLNHAVFHNGCPNLQYHQQCMRVSYSSHPCQQLLFVIFLMIVILTSVKWHLIVVLICISPMISDDELLFICLLTLYIAHLEKCLFRSSVFFFFFAVPCGLCILVFWPGIKPRPRQWKHQILTTGLLGNSLSILVKFVFCCWFDLYLYIFWIFTPHHIYICKYLLPFSRLSFYFNNFLHYENAF